MTEEETATEQGIDYSGYDYPDDTVYRLTGTVRVNNTSLYITIPTAWGFETGDEVAMEIVNLRTGARSRVITTVRYTGTSYRVTIPQICREDVDRNGLATIAVIGMDGYNRRVAACGTPAERAAIFREEAV